MTEFLRKEVAAVTISISLMLVGCADNVTDLDTSRAQNEVSKEALRTLGFDPASAESFGDYFVIEGDMVVPKSALQKLRLPKGPQFHFATHNLVSSGVIDSVVVDGSALLPSWKSALQQAISEWNSIPGTRVRFVEGTSSRHIVAIMSSMSWNPVTCEGNVALSKTPLGSGLPGDTIWVNANAAVCLTSSSMKRNMAHELGHTIGFRHTNYLSMGEPPEPKGANLVPGTPSNPNDDPASVMKGSTGLAFWNGFSYYDKLATFVLYGPLPPVIQYTYPSGATVASWPAMDDVVNYRFTLTKHTSYRDPNNEWWDWSEPVFDSGLQSSAQTMISGLSYTGHNFCEIPGDGQELTIIDLYAKLEVRYSPGYWRIFALTAPMVLAC